MQTPYTNSSFVFVGFKLISTNEAETTEIQYNAQYDKPHIHIYHRVSPFYPGTNIQVFQGKENHKPYATLQ